MSKQPSTPRSPRETNLKPDFADFLHRVRQTEGVLEAWPGINNLTYVKLENCRLICLPNLNISNLHTYIVEMGNSGSRSRSASAGSTDSNFNKTSNIVRSTSVQPACSPNIRSYTMRRRNSDSRLNILNMSKHKKSLCRPWRSLETSNSHLNEKRKSGRKTPNNKIVDDVMLNNKVADTFGLDLQPQFRNGDSQYIVMSKHSDQTHAFSKLTKTLAEDNGNQRDVRGPVTNYLNVTKCEGHGDACDITSASELSDEDHIKLTDAEWDTDDVFHRNMTAFNFIRNKMVTHSCLSKKSPMKPIFQRRCSMDSQITFQENRTVRKKKSKRSIKIARPGHKHAMYIPGADTLGGLPEEELIPCTIQDHHMTDKSKIHANLKPGYLSSRPQLFRTSSCPVIFEGSESEGSSSETEDKQSELRSSNLTDENQINNKTLDASAFNRESTEINTLLTGVNNKKKNSRRFKSQKNKNAQQNCRDFHLKSNQQEDTSGSTSELLGVTFIVSGRSNRGQCKSVSNGEKTRMVMPISSSFQGHEEKESRFNHDSKCSAFTLLNQRRKPRHFVQNSHKSATTLKTCDSETKLRSESWREPDQTNNLSNSTRFMQFSESDITSSDSSDCVSGASCLSDVSSKTRLDSQEESDSLSDCDLLLLLQQQQRLKCY